MKRNPRASRLLTPCLDNTRLLIRILSTGGLISPSLHWLSSSCYPWWATNRSKEIKDWLIDGFLFGLQTIILEQSLRTKRKEHKMKEIKEKDWQAISVQNDSWLHIHRLAELVSKELNVYYRSRNPRCGEMEWRENLREIHERL